MFFLSCAASRIASFDSFRGIAFVGGFANADVLDSGKGWAGAVRFRPQLRRPFDAFRARADTFSLGVCNGCQLMALLGWVPGPEREEVVTAAATAAASASTVSASTSAGGTSASSGASATMAAASDLVDAAVIASGSDDDESMDGHADANDGMLQPRFTRNASGRFESRWAAVRVEADTRCVLLRGMQVCRKDHCPLGFSCSTAK